MAVADDPEIRRSPLAPFAIAGAVIAVAVIGGLGSDTTSEWYRTLDRPSFQPDGSVFGPVWTVLYIALGVSAWMAWRHVTGPRRNLVLALYGVNFVLNAAWTLIFFKGHAPVAAGVEIIVLLATIVWMFFAVLHFTKLGAWLLVPYGAWVAFATAITWAVAANN